MGVVPCDHEYLNFKGGKFSKSRSGAVEVPYFLTRYDPDALRFYLIATLPETRDTEACPEALEGLSWEDSLERNNNELVATARLKSSAELGRSPRAEAWGNLANARGYSGPLSFAYKRFDGHVPEPGELDESLIDEEYRRLEA